MDTKPFEQVAIDLIIRLPQIRKLNTILTIVNYKCSCATIFLPVSDTITGAEITQIYIDYIYR